MSTSPFEHPGLLAEFDQEVADADAALDRLVAVVRADIALHGHDHGIADLGGAIVSFEPQVVEGLLIAAVRRLALQAP